MRQKIALTISFLIIMKVFCQSLISKDEWVDKLVYLVNQTTIYTKEQGKNLLDYDGTAWYCDCSGLMKALFNGRNVYSEKIGNDVNKTLPVTADLNTDNLIEKCKDLSTDFSLLKKDEPRLLYLKVMLGHI